MGSHSFLTILGYVENAICLAALGFILFRKKRRDHWALTALLSVRAFTGISLSILLNASRPNARHLTILTEYKLYFYFYWTSFAVESILVFFVVYWVYRVTLAPLKGLQRLGMLIFRWVAAICVALAFLSALAPHVSAPQSLMAATSQLLRAQSILTFGLVLFILFAARPMGLSYRSKTFGIAVGLGILAMTDLVQSLGIDRNPPTRSVYPCVSGIVLCLVLGMWTIYLALPEPKRGMILLPTTSPLLRWNQMALALFSDEPV